MDLGRWDRLGDPCVTTVPCDLPPAVRLGRVPSESSVVPFKPQHLEPDRIPTCAGSHVLAMESVDSHCGVCGSQHGQRTSGTSHVRTFPVQENIITWDSSLEATGSPFAPRNLLLQTRFSTMQGTLALILIFFFFGREGTEVGKGI